MPKKAVGAANKGESDTETRETRTTDDMISETGGDVDTDKPTEAAGADPAGSVMANEELIEPAQCHCGGKDNDEMIQCSDCHKWLHYQCTLLPIYMLKQLCTKNRKYQCMDCIEIDAKDLTKFNLQSEDEQQLVYSRLNRSCIHCPPQTESLDGPAQAKYTRPDEETRRIQEIITETDEKYDTLELKFRDINHKLQTCTSTITEKETKITTLEKELKQQSLSTKQAETATKQEKKKVKELEEKLKLRNQEIEKLKTPLANNMARDHQLQATVATQVKTINELRKKLENAPENLHPPQAPASSSLNSGGLIHQPIIHHRAPVEDEEAPPIIITTQKLNCPSTLVGIVVGKQGSRIKMLEKENSVFITIDRTKDSRNNQAIYIMGRSNNVKRTSQIITRRITCKFHKTNSCSHGESCKFMHPENNNQHDTPDNLGQQAENEQRQCPSGNIRYEQQQQTHTNELNSNSSTNDPKNMPTTSLQRGPPVLPL